MSTRSAILLLVLTSLCVAAEHKLFNGKNLDGWEIVGDGFWAVRSDGVLVGQGDSKAGRPQHQSWLYTREEFEEFDLKAEFWLRRGANSGISIRDTSRARYAQGAEWDSKKTPSHIGYEIQLINSDKPQKHDSGSLYLFQPAPKKAMKPDDWNVIEIESRKDRIRIRLNGELMADHPGDPARPTRGPIGLQLHDKETVIEFRSITLRTPAR